MNVRTRFAPSPTGFLHIGGVRTALFNWLFARKHGGQFILRIDDTDQQRNVAEALQPILDGFRWLGLTWDEGAEVGGPHGPYYQSQKLHRYQDAVRELLDQGHAYWDFATEEETKAERADAEKEKRPYLYSRRWMAESPAEKSKYEAEGRRGVVRLKMPREGQCRFFDHIRGDMVVDWSSEQDHVIQRADGTVLYNLASTVDDFDMKITHVIRAEEHLSNTPRQIFIAQGLGYPLPEYAHVPFVAEPGSKNKLSKRKIAQYLKNPDFKKVYEHGQAIAQRLGLTTSAETFNPVIVDFYAQVGYLPDAILNYLVLLGWSLDDKTEDFTRQQMIDLFSLERVNKGPSSFDAKKLAAFEERHMQRLGLADKISGTVPFVSRAKLLGGPTIWDQVTRLVQVVIAAGDRIKCFGDVLEYESLFQSDSEFEFDPAAFEKRISSQKASWQYLIEFKDSFSKIDNFSSDFVRQATFGVVKNHVFSLSGLDDELILAQMDAVQHDIDELASENYGKQQVENEWFQLFLAERNIKISDIIHALRVCVTGKAVGFSVWDAIAILGRDSTIRRIERALTKLNISASFTLDKFNRSFPEAMIPMFDFEKHNSYVLLETSNCSVSQNGQSIEGRSDFYLKWTPKPIVRFDLEIVKSDFILEPGPIHILTSRGTKCDCLVSTLRSSSSGKTQVRGIVTKNWSDTNADPLSRVVFHVPNFIQYFGDPVKFENSVWLSRAEFNADRYTVRLDQLADYHKISAQAKKNGGSRITHVGQISRSDNSQFGADEVKNLLQCLQYYFSFVRGFWVAPILSIGFDRDANIIWQDWSSRVSDPWKTVDSWFPSHVKDSIATSFASFYSMWQHPERREILMLSVYWYLQANAPGGSDRGIVAAFIALEALVSYAQHIRGLESRIVTRDAFQEVVQRSGIRSEVPEHYVDLRAYGSSLGISDGPELLLHLRNSIVHPTFGNLASNADAKQFKGRIWEGWRLSVHLVESLLLWIMGYKGAYSPRISKERWEGHSVAVPWNSKS